MNHVACCALHPTDALQENLLQCPRKLTRQGQARPDCDSHLGTKSHSTHPATFEPPNPCVHPPHGTHPNTPRTPPRDRPRASVRLSPLKLPSRPGGGAHLTTPLAHSTPHGDSPHSKSTSPTCAAGLRPPAPPSPPLHCPARDRCLASRALSACIARVMGHMHALPRCPSEPDTRHPAPSPNEALRAPSALASPTACAASPARRLDLSPRPLVCDVLCRPRCPCPPQPRTTSYAMSESHVASCWLAGCGICAPLAMGDA